MTAYILKSSLSLLLLFGLYWFLLRKEKLFVFNRFFLIFSIVFSLIIPFISIPVNLGNNEAGNNIITAINSSVPVFAEEQSFVDMAEYQSVNDMLPAPTAFYEGINYPVLLLLLYLAGVIVLLVRFLRNITFISRQIKSSEKIVYSGQRLVLTDNQVNPFCFLSTIFVSKQAYLNNQIAGELLNHELEHIRQAHSVDVIFIELIQIVYWFNPIIILYNKAVRVNHEYLADNGVIQDSPDVITYADKLINFVTFNRNVPLTSGFNPSLTRKRLIMLTKSRSGVINYGTRIFITVNLAAALFLILSFTPVYSEQSEAVLDSGQLKEPQSLKVMDIDRNEYKTVKIGTNIWMAENLKTTKYNDGTDIPLVREDKDWQKYEAGYSWYNNDEAENKNTYGALYNWYAVNTNKLCPTGWHVPTHAEYSYLLDPSFRDSIGGNLKEKGNLHWNLPNTGATNETGFTALPGGYRGFSGSFYFKGEQGIWWTSTSENEFVGISWNLLNDHSRFSPYWTSKRVGFSVRCIMDNTNESGIKHQMALDDTLDKALKIVDGVEYFGKIADIPEQEIQTMSILKDKSATAVFGEKGKNGVVVITTNRKNKVPVQQNSATLIIPAGKAENSNGKDDIVISTTSNNYLYRGFANPVDVKVKGIASEKISAEITNGSIKRVDTGWEVTPGDENESVVTMYVSGKKRFEKLFTVRDLPNPVPVFQNKSSGSVSRSIASKDYVLEAVLKDPDPGIKFEIVSFNMGMRVDSTDIEISSDGNKFTDEMRSMLAGLTRGKYLFIKDIKAIGPDNKVRDLSPIVLKID